MKLCRSLSSVFQCMQRTPAWHNYNVVRHIFQGNGIQGVTFREATEHDISSIVALSKLAHKDWYQIDYLPGWLPKVLKDPNRITSVGVRGNDEQVVSYMMSLAGPDNGRTLLFEAGRTHPDIAGTGVMGSCFVWSLARQTAQNPGWKRIRASTIHEKHVVNNAGKKFKILGRRMYIRVRLPLSPSLLSSLSPIEPRAPVKMSRLTPEAFENVLSDSGTVDHLYPGDTISVGYNVFRPLPSNVQYITYFHNNVLFNDDGLALSIGGQVPCDDDRAWRYNFIFDGTIDLNTCFEHLADHLSLCVHSQAQQQNPKREVHLILLLSTSMKNFYNQDTVLRMVAEFLNIGLENVSVRDLYLFEYI